MKNKNRTLIFLLIVISVCALLVGLNISKQAMNTPAAADHTQTSQTEPVRKPYVVYEAVFLDTSEITEVFRNIRGEKAPYELSPKDYHITFTFRPAFASYKLYGTKVTANGISYKAGDVIDDEGGTTQNEGILVNLQADNPEFKQLINSIHKHAWHITGSYSHKAKYTGDLDFSDAEPVMFTISGTFGAYMSDGTFRFIPEETAAFARPESNKAVGNPSEITLYLWDDAIKDNKTYTDTSKENIQTFTELFDLMYAQTESSDDILVLDEVYESPQEGLIQNGSKFLTFLNQDTVFKNETYHDAWYLEVISSETMQRKCVILPEGSRYAPMLKLLLENMHYQELNREIGTRN